MPASTIEEDYSRLLENVQASNARGAGYYGARLLRALNTGGTLAFPKISLSEMRLVRGFQSLERLLSQINEYGTEPAPPLPPSDTGPTE